MLTNLPYEAAHVRRLAEEGVDVVLNMCEDREYLSGQRAEVEAAYGREGLDEDRSLLLEDLGEHPLELFDHAVARIDAARDDGRNIVVHCRGGRERSAAIAAAVLVVHDDFTVTEAIESVHAIAPQASPLPHQRAALERWAASR